MRSLSTALLTSQISLSYSRPLWQFALSRTSATTRGYDNTRIASISHPETPDSQKAEVVLRNYDQALTSLDFEAYTGVISYGINTGATRTAWATGTVYAIDDIVVPVTATGYQYRCSVAGQVPPQNLPGLSPWVRRLRKPPGLPGRWMGTLVMSIPGQLP